MKTVALILAVVAALVMYGIGWLGYWLNRDFIIAFSETLPFTYRLLAGWPDLRWWSFAIPAVVGLLSYFRILLPDSR